MLFRLGALVLDCFTVCACPDPFCNGCSNPGLFLKLPGRHANDFPLEPILKPIMNQYEYQDDDA